MPERAGLEVQVLFVRFTGDTDSFLKHSRCFAVHSSLKPKLNPEDAASRSKTAAYGIA